MTITEFLEARIAEDEAVARAATAGPWEAEAMDAGHSRYEMNVWVATGDGDTICDMDGLSRSRNEKVALDDGYKDARHIARHDPTRVLVECAAKRAIIGCWTNGVIGEVEIDGELTNPLLPLSAIYADHEDYQQEWK